jgi:hypothetical protein
MKIKISKYLILSLILLTLVPTILAAPSNASIGAKESLDQARLDIKEMKSRNISIIRVTELHDEASQIFTAQQALDRLKKNSNYKLVNEYSMDIHLIKGIAFRAKDELVIFNEAYSDASKEINLSVMDKEHNAILISFSEERFEDTLELINLGYDRLSEVQSSQTTTRLFYTTVKNTFKNFLINNWKKLVLSSITLLIIIFIFWKTISKFRIRIKLNYLILQKTTIKNLIKKMQHNYFRKKDLSEIEYGIKSKTFGEMIREIDRKIMILKTNILKINKKVSKIKK